MSLQKFKESKDYNTLTLLLKESFKMHNYETNKLTNFLVNDYNWNYKDFIFKSGIKGKIFGNVRNINYETKNVDLYKEDTTSEVYGALGYLSQLNLENKINNTAKHFFGFNKSSKGYIFS